MRRTTIHAARARPLQDALESIVEMREYDVPYHVRFEIDTDVRCGHWFMVKAKVRVVRWRGGDKSSCGSPPRVRLPARLPACPPTSSLHQLLSLPRPHALAPSRTRSLPVCLSPPSPSSPSPSPSPP